MENLISGSLDRVLQRLALGILLLAVGLSAQAESTQGEYYKWTDAEGQVHYTQKPPPELDREAVQELKLKVAPPAAVAQGEEKAQKLRCGEITLPPAMANPVARIAQLRRLSAQWQNYVDENKESGDAAIRKKVEDRRCAIDYANQEMQSLDEVQENLQRNYEEASEELAERKQLLKECEQIEVGEDREIAIAECRGEHRVRIEQLEKILRSLEQPRKILQPRQ